MIKTTTTLIAIILINFLFCTACSVTDTKENLIPTIITDSNFTIKGYNPPYIGSVYDIEFADNSYLFAAAYDNAGVYLMDRDTDLWINLVEKMDFPNNFHKIVANASGKIIAAGDGEIYASLDGGLTWTLSLRDGSIPFHRVQALAMSENGSVIASVFKIASTTPSSGYIVSTSGTGSWQYITPPFFIHDFKFIGNTLYAATSNGLLSTTDFGKNWIRHFELPIYSISPGEGGSLWAVSEYNIQHWDGMNLTAVVPAERDIINSIAFHSSQSVYYSYGQLHGVYRLNPFTGESIKVDLNIDNPIIHFLKVYENDLYIGTHEHGAIQFSHNNSDKNYKKIGMPSRVNSLIKDTNQNLLISLSSSSRSNNGLWIQKNQTTDWEKISDQSSVLVTKNGDFFISDGLTVHRSSDHGKTWNNTELIVPENDQFGIDSHWISKNGNLRIIGSGAFNVETKTILEFRNDQWMILGEIPLIEIPFGSVVETEATVFISNRKGIYKLTEDLKSIESVRPSNLNFESFLFSDNIGRLYIIDRDNVILRSDSNGKEWHPFLIPEESFAYFPIFTDSQNRLWFRGLKNNHAMNTVIDRFLIVANSDGSSFKRLVSDQWKNSTHFSIAEKSDGEIYISTSSNGLQVLETI